jgi:hypothetical protein
VGQTEPPVSKQDNSGGAKESSIECPASTGHLYRFLSSGDSIAFAVFKAESVVIHRLKNSPSMRSCHLGLIYLRDVIRSRLQFHNVQ